MAPLAEAWQLSTYRRLDALDVPAFNLVDLSDLVPDRKTRPARLHRLTTALPREVMSLADWLDSTPSNRLWQLSDIERLSLLFRYLSSPLRYEPNNVYQVHRAVPSARCIFPVDLLLTQTDRDGVSRTYLYHPDFHALEALGEADASDDRGSGARTVIAGVGRFWKLARKYGDFTPFPVMLEAGMLLAQLRFLRRALGWSGTGTDGGRQREFCKGDLEFPIFAETVDRPEFDMADLPVRDVVLAIQAEPTDAGRRFERLSFFMDLFDTPSGPPSLESNAPPERLEPGTFPPDRGFLETLRLRHSSNDVTGMAPGMDGEDGLLERFSRLSRMVGAKRERLPGEDQIDVVMLWPGRVAPDAGIYDRKGRTLAKIDRRHFANVLNRSLPSSDLRYNLQAHSLIALFTVDLHAEAMHEAAAFRDVHMAAGALAQDYCLAAAALGQFARPIRMLHEQVLELAFPIKGRIIYSLLCGSSRAANVSAELL